MIRAEHLNYQAGTFRLRDVSLDVAPGEYFVILGPPGSGKSIFLECICGLRHIESGRIHLGGKDVTQLEPRLRGIGFVPQDYALLPHLSVERNIAFGLRVTGWGRKEISEKVEAMATKLGIQSLLKRGISGLSGGEKQRTALARALILEPRVLLLDEPVCALDESMRQEVCLEIRRIQQELEVTTIHVSHNLEEALTVADRAGILHDGAFMQVGSLDALLRRPRNNFVARFMRCGNILDGEVMEEGPGPECTTVQVEGTRLVIPGRHAGRVQLVIRPEKIELKPEESAGGPAENSLPVRIVRSFDACNYVRVELQGSLRLTAHVPHSMHNGLGSHEHGKFIAVLKREAIHVLG